MKERRGFERYELVIQAKVFFYRRKAQGRWMQAMSKDISSQGVFFHSDEPLPLGTKVYIEFVLPVSSLPSSQARNSRFECFGTVIRKESGGMAVCFDKSCKITPVGSNVPESTTH
jgi:hypothetical protein